MCRAEDVPLAVLPPGLIGEATGRANMAAAVKAGPFAEPLKECL